MSEATDLVEWLRAQLDDDERTATNRGRLAGDVWTAVEVAPGRWEVVGAGRGVVAQNLPQWEAEHIARHDPARVLAEVAAKRRLLDDAAEYVEDGTEAATDGLAYRVLGYLALPYADRSGYRDEWRP